MCCGCLATRRLHCSSAPTAVESMDLYGKLQLSWSCGYKGTQLQFIDNTTLAYGCGNTLTFVNCNGQHVRSLPSEGRGVGPIAVSPRSGLIAYAEMTLQPQIFVLKYPDCSLEARLRDKAQLEYTSLAFSGDGKKIASLSGIPDYLLTLWDWKEEVELCSATAGLGGSSISINPLNWKQLCLLGPKRATLWTLEQCDTQNLLSPLEVELPDKATPVGTLVEPKQAPITIPHKTSSTDQIGKKLETKSNHPLSLALNSPPDLSNVVYRESYDEFMRKKDSVVLTALCWTPHQSIYMGCVGGQLLLADFEGGVVKVVANPQAIQIKDPSSYSLLSHSTSEEDSPQAGDGGETPQTGHAVLTNGCIECLSLSRRGLFTAGKNGVICCFEQSSELQLLDSHRLQHPITSLAWTTEYDQIAIGTKQGAIYLMDPTNLSDITLISDHHHSVLVGVDMLTPRFQHCVTCRSEGIVQVWNIEEGTHVATLNLGTECSSLACPLSCHMTAVGTASGHLCVLSLTDPTTPRLVLRRHVHHSSIKAICYDQNGRFMGTVSSTGPVFLYDARPSSQFAVIGHLAIGGEVVDLSILSLGAGKDAKTQVAVLTLNGGKKRVTLFQIPNSVVDEAPPELYADATKQFATDFIFKQEATFTEPVNWCILTPGNHAFAQLESSLQLAKYTLPPPDEKEAVDWELSPESSYSAHELDGGQAALSFHQKWLASVAPDGQLMLRLVENPERSVSCTPHHYNLGGCRGVVFSADSHIITTGDTGTLTCWTWDFTDHGSAKATVASEYARRCLRSLEGLHSRENAALEGMPVVDGEGEDGKEKTWLEIAEEEAHRAEDEKYSEIKAQLRKEIGELRENVLSMIATNDHLPDIEKLGRHEFILDMEEHQRLQAEEEQLIQQVHEEIELSNLAKMFLREQIKKECWSDMAVKGKVAKAFHSRLEVSNFAMKERGEAKLNDLEKVKTLRRIEIEERKARNEAASGLKLTFQSLNADDLLLDEEELGEKGKGQEEEEEGDPDALKGSHGAQYGGESELYYDQFELHSPVAKSHQIVLLEDCVYRIKEAFNKEFNDVFRLKEIEIARILEKNVRIRTIISQLKLDEPLVQPSLDTHEEPHRLLTVEDDEVTVEKYISSEDEKKAEEDAKLEEARKLAEMGDNPRERALDMMMGGRLEANVEEDLFKDLPRPDFMQKDPAEMTEDEIRTARDFEKKEKEFLEEREKLKMALEAELKKLQGSIVQAMEQFDDRLNKLFQLKIKTEMAVHQEELKILRLARALLIEEEVIKREDQLNQLLQEKKAAKVQLGGIINTTKGQVDEAREQYEHMQTEDREMDRYFKRDFADCEQYTDQLYKLFRKRPRGQRLKVGPSEGILVQDPKSPNPFAQRPSSAVGGRGSDPMAELDDPSHMPEGLERSSWERFVIARRKKLESEQKVKVFALKLAEMTAFLQRRQAEDELIQQEIQEAFKELNKLQEDKNLFDMNLEIQFLLKQGQVEVDMGEFVPDFSDSVLVHRSSIKELNSQIKTLGQSKLVSMTECSDFKRGIHLLEWEHRKMLMEAEDLVEKSRDIQMLRVTKELQQRLMEENVVGKDQHEIETLEKTIELNQKMHHKNLLGKKRGLGKLEQHIGGRRTENKDMDRELMELQVTMAERQAVENLAGVPPSEANAEQRMHDIVTRRRLVEQVKAQAQEISVLKTEVEKLRMRTFPALVQVD